MLERLAPEQDKIEGKDLADYLIKQDWRKYRPQPEPIEQPEIIAAPEPEYVETVKSEKSEKSEAKETSFISAKYKVWESLDYYTKLFWNNGRGGKDGYTKHKYLMQNLSRLS